MVEWIAPDGTRVSDQLVQAVFHPGTEAILLRLGWKRVNRQRIDEPHEVFGFTD